MKPVDFDKMSEQEKNNAARSLFNSMRGHFVIGQALFQAIKVMKKEKYPETSNIQDMELLMERLFPLYAATHSPEMQKACAELRKGLGR